MVFPRLDGRLGSESRDAEAVFDRTALSLWHRLEEGLSLEVVDGFCREQMALAEAAQNQAALEVLRHVHHFIRGLTGPSDGPAPEGESLRASLGAISAAGLPAGVAFVRLLRQVSAFVFGRYQDAHREGEGALPLRAAISGSRIEATQAYFRGLTAAAIFPTAAPESRAALQAEIQ
ncbi:MAG TPA: hypothetical protein VGG33_19360, partial [Polyangia bacterium]